MQSLHTHLNIILLNADVAPQTFSRRDCFNRSDNRSRQSQYLLLKRVLIKNEYITNKCMKVW